ncbi:MAG: hypothetical protein H6765_02340 [Candidatus Peribacteria bacterium]|nr:MAG: hypothetical protein H6765_02340 [Candidatus Peribacteria bacterium]
MEEAKHAFYQRFGLKINFSSQIEFSKRLVDTFDLTAYAAELEQSKAEYKILFM